LIRSDEAGAKQVTMAHNNLLLILVETGLLGLVAFLGLIAAFARRIRQLLREAPSGYARDVSVAACIGLVSAFLMGMTAATFVETIWWYVAGLALAAARLAAAPKVGGQGAGLAARASQARQGEAIP
jgi:O-antigen ligase